MAKFKRQNFTTKYLQHKQAGKNEWEKRIAKNSTGCGVEGFFGGVGDEPNESVNCPQWETFCCKKKTSYKGEKIFLSRWTQFSVKCYWHRLTLLLTAISRNAIMPCIVWKLWGQFYKNISQECKEI